MELPKLRLWVRMIANGIRESMEEPPNVPMFTAPISKCAKHKSLHDAVVDAAKVVAQVHLQHHGMCRVLHNKQ